MCDGTVYPSKMSAPPRGAKGEEILVPLCVPREHLRPPESIRSTLIASSLRSLRERGHEANYLARLAGPWKDMPFRAIAGLWLPIEAGLAHYRACDALGLSVSEEVAIGREVGERIHGTFLATMLRAAKTAGVTPWVPFMYTAKLYERIFDGGGCCVTKRGPKDACVEITCNPVMGIPYFRHAMRGLWLAAVDLFCTRSFAVELGHTESSCKVRISWA